MFITKFIECIVIGLVQDPLPCKYHSCPQVITEYQYSAIYSVNLFPENCRFACVCKYVDRNGSTAMLATNRSAGITPDVNLRNPLHTDNKVHNQRIHPGFEIMGRRYQKFKSKVSVVPKKGMMSAKKEKKSKKLQFLKKYNGLNFTQDILHQGMLHYESRQDKQR